MKRGKGTREESEAPAPTVTESQLAELKAKLAAAGREPIQPLGTVSDCPNCGGRMITTNDLDRTLAVPGFVFVVTRLPGAKCERCGSSELDGPGIAILETTAPRELLADYETSVTHSSGATLGTYFKMDLVRVLGLSGSERLLWKVVDRDKALVSVQREPHLGRVGDGRETKPVRRRRVSKAEA